MPNKPTPKQLDAENRDLRVRLEKAEATLSEILSGEADALFVTGAGGAQLFTLKGADQSYRTLIENMSEGALTLTPEGLVLYANRRFAGMLRTPLEKVIGSEIHHWFAPESRQVIQALLQKEAVDSHHEELNLAAADGTQVPIYLSVSRLHLDGIPDSICMVATDLTEQKRNEAILAAEKLSNAILEQAADAIVICDETGRIMRASKQAQTLYGKSPIGQLFAQVFPLRHLDGTAFSAVGAIDTNRSMSVEAKLDCQGQEFDLLVSVGHLKGTRDELLGSVVTLTDITERKQAVEHLKLFRALLDNSSDAIEVLDPVTLRILDVNETQCRALGYSREELLSMKITDIDSALNADLLKVIEEQIRKTGAARVESIHRRKDGSTFPVEVSSKLIELGKPYALNIVRDITKRKKAEEEIKFKNTILRTQQEASPDAILVVDENAQIISYNQQFIDMWNVSPQIVGAGLDAPVLQAVTDQVENPETFVARVQYLYEHRDDKSREEIKLKDGRIVDRYSAPVTGADGKYYGRVWYFRDITERIQSELKLHESQRRFTELLENVELVSVMRDREERITYCNEYLLRLTGWRYEEVIGRNWVELFLPLEIAEQKKKFFAEILLDKPAARHHESEILTPSGEHRLIHWNNTLLRSEDGKIIGTASIGEDITDRKLAELELQHREAELAESQRITRIGSWEWAPATGVITWSKGLNYVLARDIGSPAPMFEALQQYYTPESWQRLSAVIARTIDTGAPYDLELEMIRADGAACWTSTHGEAVRGTDGAIVMLRGTVQDITDRREAEASIKSLNRVLFVLSSINTLIVRVNNRDELFREACNIAVDIGGFRMAMILIVDPSTMQPVSVTSAGKDEELLAAVKNTISTSEGMQKSLVGRVIREKKVVISNDTQNDPGLLFGKQYTAEEVRSMMVLPLIISGEAVGVIAFYTSEIEFFQEDEIKLLTELAGDISFAIDHIDKQERLNYLAYYDVLTGLANRTLFLERLAQYMGSAARSGHKLAIGLIDLERFKNINDSLGRPAGDALLKQTAQWLTQFARDDNLLARIDADHFAFVVPEVKSDGNLIVLFDNIVKTFQAHLFRVNNTNLRLAAKTGIALFPDDGTDADTLFRNAEAALTKAKASGDRFLFYKMEMNEAVAGKLAMENQLRQAIDNEEFVLHYQPKVNLVSGKVTSAEALIRWNDPHTGLVPPGRFIPILEETGMIYEVGRWALHQAIEDNKRWRAAGLAAVRIAVNVSPLQLRNINFIDEIRHIVSLDQHAAAGLELEITESLIMDNVEQNIARLQAIRAMGITIAIDDFGTGFSSLNYLSKLPVDTLKIDRSFVIEMDAPEGFALVSTIIMVAHALKLKVVAEGVETEKQSRQLLSLNCDEMQGFLFSKAVPAEIFEARFLALLTPRDEQ